MKIHKFLIQCGKYLKFLNTLKSVGYRLISVSTAVHITVSIHCTVIPRLTSDPTNEFFG